MDLPESGVRERWRWEIIEKATKHRDFHRFSMDFPAPGVRDPESGVRGALETENHRKSSETMIFIDFP